VPPDFLNSREDAMMIWAAAILAFVLYKDPKGIGGGFLGVLRALLHWKLLASFGSVLVYSATLVLAAQRLGIWHTATLKETIYWFFGTGVILVGQAISTGHVDLRRVLRRVVAATVIIEFASNLYAFPLAVELVLVFVALVFVAMQAYAPHDEAVTPETRKVIDGVVIVLGLTYFIYFLVRALSDLNGFLTRQNAERFLVGPALTLALIPALWALAWLSRRERENLRRRFDATFDSALPPA
jgi:hypothetical protein